MIPNAYRMFNFDLGETAPAVDPGRSRITRCPYAPALP